MTTDRFRDIQTALSHGKLALGALPPAPQDPLLFEKVPAEQRRNEMLIRRPSVTYLQDAWMRLRQNKMAIASSIFIVCLSIAALVGPYLIPYSYDEQEIWNQHATPNWGRTVVVVDEPSQFFADLPRPVQEVDDAALFEAPVAPKELYLLAEALSVGVALAWAPSSGAEGYRIYRSIDDQSLGLPIADVDEGALSFIDQNALQAEQDYFYHVFAFNAFGDSEGAATLHVSPKLALPLAVAQNIEAGAQVGDIIRTKAHLLGTDYLGRDMLARILSGARISLMIGFLAPLIYIFIGVIYGCVAGYIGGVVDDVMMRIADIVSTVPELLAVIMLQVFLGSGMTTLILAIVLVAWARSARQLRGEVLKLREAEFVHAARLLGTSMPKIVWRHLLPNTTGTILVLFTLAIPQAIFTEAFLSFIGLGIQPPLASWGSVTREGAKVFMTYPHELLVPAVFISLSIFAFNLLGDGMRDALDPRLRGAK